MEEDRGADIQRRNVWLLKVVKKRSNQIHFIIKIAARGGNREPNDWNKWWSAKTSERLEQVGVAMMR